MPKPTPAQLPTFGGLDLRDDPQEIGLGAAIDMLNVDLDRVGRLYTRDGLVVFSSNTGTYGSLYASLRGDGNPMLLANNTATQKVEAYDQSGTLIASSANVFTIPAYTTGFAAIGTPSASYVYATSPSGNSARFDGSTWTTVTLKTNQHLAVQQSDNRLVCAGDVSTTLSRVWFSDAGAPQTFGANNYVDLTPGDGEIISGVAYWRNQLYVFKQTKFFIFYGNTTDGSGNPIFNYRTIAGKGAVAGRGSVVAGPDGIYFVGADGLYRTQGGDPERVSTPLDPVWAGLGDDIPATWRGQLVNDAAATMRLGASPQRVFCSFVPAGNTIGSTFVWDCELRIWLYWEGPFSHITALPGARSTGGSTLVCSFEVATKTLGAFSSRSVYDDLGTAISSRYRTGFWNPGEPGAEAWVREMLLEGSGAVTVKQSKNDTVALGSGQSVTLGGYPAVAQGRDRRGVRARNLSWELSGTAPWSLSSVVPIIWGQRETGEQAP